MKGLRAERRQQLNELVVESGIENRATACVSLPTAATLTVVEVAAELLPVAQPKPPPGIRKESPVLPVPAPAPAVVGFCHHLGVLQVLRPGFKDFGAHAANLRCASALRALR